MAHKYTVRHDKSSKVCHPKQVNCASATTHKHTHTEKHTHTHTHKRSWTQTHTNRCSIYQTWLCKLQSFLCMNINECSLLLQVPSRCKFSDAPHSQRQGRQNPGLDKDEPTPARGKACERRGEKSSPWNNETKVCINQKQTVTNKQNLSYSVQINSTLFIVQEAVKQQTMKNHLWHNAICSFTNAALEIYAMLNVDVQQLIIHSIW